MMSGGVADPITCWVIGGGCYGSGYIRQFRKAHARGKMPPSRWVVLDRDSHCRAVEEFRPDDPLTFRTGQWRDLLADILATEARPHDYIIPSPFQGTLVADWLADEARRAGRTLLPLAMEEVGEGLRFEQAGAEFHVRYVSYAGWTCPVHCIEPPKCPAIRAPKAWDLRDSMAAYARARDFTLLPFTCLHWLYGVGVTPVQEFLDARERLRHGPAGRLLVASMSTCHGALSAWELGE